MLLEKKCLIRGTTPKTKTQRPTKGEVNHRELF